MDPSLARCAIHPDTPVAVGSAGSWVVTITVGRCGIPRWGGVRLYIPPGWTIPQFDHHDATGHTSIEVRSREPIRFDRYLYCGRWIELTVVDGSFAEGDAIVITYGSVSGGGCSEAPLVPVRASEFSVSVDTTGTYNFCDIASPVLEVVPGPVRCFEVLLPVEAPEDGPISARALAVDGRHNPVRVYHGELVFTVIDGSPVPAVEAVADGPVSTASMGNTIGGKVIRVHVRDRDGNSGTSNPCLSGAPYSPYELLFGDPHGHSSVSDGRAPPESYYTYARDVSALDFCVLTDHDSVGSNSNVPEHSKRLTADEWEHIKAVTNTFNDERLITLLAYEYTQTEIEVGGHRNVYYDADDAPFFPVWDPASNTPTRLFQRLRDLSIRSIVVPHHPLRFMSREHDPALQRLFEVYSMWGSSETATDDCAFSHPSKYQRGGYSLQDALAYGYRFGVVAGGDNHDSVPGIRQGTDIWRKGRMSQPPGLTGVFVTERSRTALFDALYERRCYGTTGQRIIVWFTMNGIPMGSELQLEDPRQPREFAVHAYGEGDIESIELVCSGVVAARSNCDGIAGTLMFTDDAPVLGDQYWYARVRQKDGGRAWTSPIWVDSP